jgi:hypothetical protein
MDLTIGRLAKELDLQEYKLRQMINTQLSYRNFSDFLNSYRINETAQRLRDENHIGEDESIDGVEITIN